jgi:hypothetical protein
MFRKNKQEDIIKFYASIDNLESNPDVVPYPAKKYVPSWWTSLPNRNEKPNHTFPTIKRCPAIPDFFTQGFILPMWGDMYVHGIDRHQCVHNESPIAYNLDINGKANNKTMSQHPNPMFLEYYQPDVGRKVETIIKFDSPWRAITPKGWSTMVLPLFYEFNPFFTIMPGVVDTDTIHEMSHPALFHTDKKFFVKAGSPICMYIPFKRTKLNFEIISKTAQMDQYFDNVLNNWKSKQTSDLGFGFSHAYRKMQRERDSE